MSHRCDLYDVNENQCVNLTRIVASASEIENSPDIINLDPNLPHSFSTIKVIQGDKTVLTDSFRTIPFILTKLFSMISINTPSTNLDKHSTQVRQ